MANRKISRCLNDLRELADKATAADAALLDDVIAQGQAFADSARAILRGAVGSERSAPVRGTPPAPPPAAAVAAARAAINTSSVQPPGAASAAGRELMDTADALPFRAPGAGEPTAQEWIDGIAAETLGTAYEHDAWLWMTAGDGQKLWGMLKTAAEQLEFLRKKARDLEAADTNY